MKLFDLFATLSLDTTGFVDKINEAIAKADDLSGKLGGLSSNADNAKASAEGFGESIGSNVTAKAVALGNAIWDMSKAAANLALNFGKSMVTAAAEVQANEAQFNAAFAGITDQATAAIGRVSEETNILDVRLRNVATKSFSQFKGAGIEASQALAMSEQYMLLAADAAAYYDITLEDADLKLRSFIRGNAEAGDAIGLFTSEAQRDQYALDAYGDKWAKLTEDQRQFLMLDISRSIYEQSGAMGQAEREAHAYTNVLANLQAKWQTVIGKLGGPILESVIPAIEKLTDFLGSNPEIIEKLADLFGQIASFTADTLITGLEWLSNNAGFVLSVLEAVLGTLQGIFSYAGQNLEFGVTAQVEAAQEIGSDIESQTGSETLGLLAEGQTLSTSLLSSDSFVNWGSLFGWGNRHGLDYVPYDGYMTYLHEGESVLTKQEADAMRKNGSNSNGTGYEDLLQEVRNLRTAITGMSVSMDGTKVGRIVTPTVSKRIATRSRVMRYVTT